VANYFGQTYRENRRFLRSKDGIFFLQQRRKLLMYPSFKHLFFATHLMTMIQAVIILKSLVQKETIDQYLKIQGQNSMQNHGRIKHHLIRERFLQDITFQYQFKDQEQTTIILPFLNRALNHIYQREPDKLYDYPYSRLEEDFSTSIVDAFEHYGFELYQSNFVHLMPLALHDRNSKAFYQPDARVVLIINRQGRLDVSISLFDKGVKKPNLQSIQERLNLAIKPYFAHQRNELIEQLKVHGFLSEGYAKSMIRDKKASFIRRYKD